MNLDKLYAWIVSIAIGFAATGNLDVLQRWIWRAQARIIYESRSSQWGSPRFWSQSRGVHIRTVHVGRRIKGRPRPDVSATLSRVSR